MSIAIKLLSAPSHPSLQIMPCLSVMCLLALLQQRCPTSVASPLGRTVYRSLECCMSSSLDPATRKVVVSTGMSWYTTVLGLGFPYVTPPVRSLWNLMRPASSHPGTPVVLCHLAGYLSPLQQDRALHAQIASLLLITLNDDYSLPCYRVKTCSTPVGIVTLNCIMPASSSDCLATHVQRGDA